LQETDRAPRGADGAGYESRVEQDSGRELVERVKGRAVEGAVGGDGKDGEDEGKKAS